ncbi:MULTISPECIES: hydrolase/acyltransferase [Brevibacillus]|jgi:predicted ester cyclase|uniref:Hydrolase/acyltransferase n=1 Tax=Brevibacillus parabrevis TaxID=54914 RepID=A0A4Y3PUL1_BREPA|nr:MULTISPECIES: hydrolase/acyltransferase [Brevibacillus]TGV29974.1 hydrolase/acyltransferase [Mesorhizobium sp. M00.F.Ca.ET.186.01.1.1]MBU8715655.1 hydrolase/acyltransferase [Brevibacillus parabrevis]MDR5001766.1 hydrolase/acyltransferase [Brevibacillus parabrevis]MED1721232.1 hydrolase/acyltransferase [Brevibacillus parabrevis]MED2258046.1 hydrolase/acyltransferase [Brevibacillus parabrevis]
MRYLILQEKDGLTFVALPETHMYQLVALFKRLYKEIDKLTIEDRPQLPTVLAECADLELLGSGLAVVDGLDYVSSLEERFAALPESQYPLISLLTEIRALQAQLEFLRDEE